MATKFQYRIAAVIVPEGAKVAGVVTWFAANIGPNAVPPAAEWQPLNPSGLASDPVTHRWQPGIALTASDAKKVLLRMCTLAGVTAPTPAQWDNATKAQRVSWWQSVKTAVRTNWGAWVGLCGNTDAWDSIEAALTAMGLKRRQAA